MIFKNYSVPWHVIAIFCEVISLGFGKNIMMKHDFVTIDVQELI